MRGQLEHSHWHQRAARRSEQQHCGRRRRRNRVRGRHICRLRLSAIVGTGAQWATIAGGIHHTVNGYTATVGGGDTNSALDANATVSGGYQNSASLDASTVSGGSNNTASGSGSAIGGGSSSAASGDYSNIPGGYSNTAAGFASAVLGGTNNGAAGNFATVVGASLNHAGGLLSFAAGNGAQVRDAAQSGTTLGDAGIFVGRTIQLTPAMVISPRPASISFWSGRWAAWPSAARRSAQMSN